MDYEYELELKSALVVELFREHHIDIPTPPILTDHHDYHYRNKMEYSLYWDHDTEHISLAFHQRGSHRKIPITHSSIERPEIFTAASAIVDDLNARGEEARKYQSLLLRCNGVGEVSGGLYENGQPHPVFRNLTDTILGHRYFYSPNGFFQINLPVYELALNEIKRHITTDKILDLYAGVGTIGLSVALGHHLTLVECDKFAFGEMVKNINSSTRSHHEDSVMHDSQSINSVNPKTISEQKRVQSNNIVAILDKSENVTDYIEPDQTVILDPPRAGCDKRLIDKLNEVRPTKIIYLSCNPATQARDIEALLLKYRLDSITTFNFFPRTPHIENLAILSRKP